MSDRADLPLEAREFSVVMAFDAFRACIGVPPKRFDLPQIIRWMNQFGEEVGQRHTRLAAACRAMYDAMWAGATPPRDERANRAERDEQDARRYRELRRIVYIDKDDSFDAYDEDQMDAELDRRIANREQEGK